MKNIYVPWFWNREDSIFKWYLKWDALIIQENLRKVWVDKLYEIFSKYSPSDIYTKLLKRYPLINKQILEWVLSNLSNFRWITRNLNITVQFTQKKLSQILDQEDKIRIVWHSQWGLVVMLSLMQNPNFLQKILQIDLLAPLSKFQIWRNFHQSNKWYLHKKWVLIRESYINSLDRQDEKQDLLKDFLDFLKQNDYKGKVYLMVSQTDTVVNIEHYDLDEYSKYFFVTISKLEDWWHNLGYNK